MDVDEVRGGAEVVELDEAVCARKAFAAAQRVVVVVDRDRVAGLLLQPDLEVRQPAGLS